MRNIQRESRPTARIKHIDILFRWEFWREIERNKEASCTEQESEISKRENTATRHNNQRGKTRQNQNLFGVI